MRKIAVIGAGTMGNGIAHTFAQSGYEVSLIDISTDSLERGINTIEKNLDRMLKREKISELAKHQATLIFYLSVHLLNKISKEAIEGGYKKTTPVAVVYKASRKDQKIILGTLTDIAKKVRDEKIRMTAIVIIGDVIKPKSYEYSKFLETDSGSSEAAINPFFLYQFNPKWSLLAEFIIAFNAKSTSNSLSPFTYASTITGIAWYPIIQPV